MRKTINLQNENLKKRHPSAQNYFRKLRKINMSIQVKVKLEKNLEFKHVIT